MDDLSLTSTKLNAWLAVRLVVFVAYFALAKWLLHGSPHAHFLYRLIAPIMALLFVVTIIAIRKLWLASHA